MKSLILGIAFLFVGAHIPSINAAWTQVSAEEREIQQILLNVVRIKERFTAMGAGISSPGLHHAIFQYLKELGTHASFKVLKSFIEDGTLPKCFLNMA